ncbi:MAG: amino acid adenylation domain-containing protein [Clostridia bacterium]|nr:amino acid adenylation domain-containing protein [Clostridia bacterium]
MNRRANRIAHALQKRGVREGGSVVLLMHRTANLIVSMMAVLKAGAAYIPMDVEYPEERVQYVIEDADADCVITERDLPKAVSVDALLEETDESNPPIHVDGDRTAYMIYTSGSTGRPKGVAVAHCSLSNLCVPDPENNYFYMRTPMPESVVQMATVSFDASILDIMPPLLNGMRVIFADDEENRNAEHLTRLIRREKPAVLGDMTASKLQQFLQSPAFAGELNRFEACAVGGEAFMPALYDKIRSLSDLDIYNSYGPTETTVHSNTRIIQRENIMSVGRQLYNVQCDIRDIDGKVLPDGVVGEHWIGGYGVSKGYHNQPEKTAAAFLTLNGVRYFRSGDFAYKLPDGEIVVLGRRDGQIKLRGLRIEIGEIEQSMLAYPAVKAAAVVIRRINKTEHLCGYYTADSDVNLDDFRAFLTSRLTPYMVPTVLMRLEKMPYTPNGKLDRRNLPEPELKRDYVAPCNDVETFFCNVFEEALDIEQVGATDDFFAVGGTSLLAIQVTILASNGGYDIKFRDVFEHPTPRELAEFFSGHEARSGEIDAISNYDYTAIHERLGQNTFENYLHGERRPMRRVLLTGGTGFLGAHVLKELLENTDAVVYCLVRGGKLSGAERLLGRLFYYFDNDYADLLGGRLMIVEGEITDAESLKRLDDVEPDMVFNCAASVKHFSAGSDIYDTNVLGVQNVLEYAVRHGARMIHISTTSTAGEILLDGRHEHFVYDERTLFRGQALDNQYLSSKFLAERLVLAAAAEGRDAKIIRVGNLMARDADGIFQINFRTNGFINRLKAYATLKAMPFEKMLQRLEMSPIDLTAKAIVKLAQTPAACCLFNCYNCHTVNYGDLLKAANDNGLDIAPVTQAVFEQKLEAAKRDRDMQSGIGGLISTVGMGTSSQRALTPVSNDYTTTVLFNEGVFWPVITEDYLILISV